jgi:Glycosyl hydrolases family 16
VTAGLLEAQRHAAPHQPVGVAGNWTVVFDDEFNGTSLDMRAWNTHDGYANQNGVTDYASNVTVSGGYATLKLSSPGSGAAIETITAALDVGDVAEARIKFAGAGSTVYNWPAFWTAGPGWPLSGENDIAEGLGTLTVSYHSSSGTQHYGTVPGSWVGSFHTYTIERLAHESIVFWDGRLIKTYSTNDNEQPEHLIFTIGVAGPPAIGASGQMQVDYARIWEPASGER